MQNIKDFEEFLYEFGVFRTNLKCRFINESTDKFIEDINKIVKLRGQNILVVNDIKLAETLGKENSVLCIYFDKTSKPTSTEKIDFRFVEIKRNGTDIHQDMKNKLGEIFSEYKSKNIEFGFIFNISPDTHSPLNYEVVANLNLYIFTTAFTVKFTTFYSFDELDVSDQFEKILGEPYGKTHGKKKINFSKFGIDDVLEAYNGKMSIEMIKEENPELILCDIGMPKIKGTEVLKFAPNLPKAGK